MSRWTGAHLVTGATGFVGGALVAELLQRTDQEIVVLVRPGESTADARFRTTFAEAARAYALDPRVIDEAGRRCRVVAGDITLSGCGLEGNLGVRVAQLWHCAASLNFEDRFLAEIRTSNVGGTRNALELAGRLGVEAFNHVSTAAVSGRRLGVIAEQVNYDEETSNHYERSKLDAERLVATHEGMRVRIFRPAVVLGHSRTFAATGFFGFHGFVRNLVEFRVQMERMQAGLLAQMPLSVVADAEARINLNPVDSVVREAVSIGLAEGSAGVYSLAHPNSTPVGVALRPLFRMLNLPEPRLVSSREDFEWLDWKLADRLDFYSDWLVGERIFSRSRTDAALGATRQAEPALDEADIEAHARWYVDRLGATGRATTR